MATTYQSPVPRIIEELNKRRETCIRLAEQESFESRGTERVAFLLGKVEAYKQAIDLIETEIPSINGKQTDLPKD